MGLGPPVCEKCMVIYDFKHSYGWECPICKTNSPNHFNTSPMDLSKMGQSDIKANLSTYVQSFSKDAREIFEYFNFIEFAGLLDDANLLYKVVQKFATTDLSPKNILS